MMRILLQKEVDRLKKKIIQLSTLVEESVYKSVKSIAERDYKLAEQVISDDAEIDQMEVEVEEDCLKVLALHQPVAVDLRFIIAVLKMNNDLERIGDLALNIAEGSKFLCSQPVVSVPFDFPAMSQKVQTMLRLSVDSLINTDEKTAQSVLEMDDEIDEIHRDMYRQVSEELQKNPKSVDCLIRLLSVSRNLERIADHTTNIAEDIIYMITGEIVRHQSALL